MKRISPCVSARLFANLSLAFLSACALSQTWGTYQGNIAHTGYVPVTVDPAGFTVAWQVHSPHNLQLTQASGGDGKVFVSEAGYFTDSSLWAVNAATGGTLWSQTYTNTFSVNAPAYANGKVYVQTCDNSADTYLRCYDSGGGFGFRVPFGAQWEHYLAPAVDGGVVYMDGGVYGGMYAFAASDGSFGWFQNTLNQYDQWTPTLDATYAYTFLGTQFSDDGTAGLYAVNRLTGLVDFHIQDPSYSWAGWSMGEAVALSGGFGYVTQGGRLIAFDIPGRRIAWQQIRSCTGQPDIVGNTVYVVDAGTLSAFNATNGNFLWAWEPPSGSLSGTILVTNNVAFVGTDTATYGIDLSTHNQVWTTNVSGQRSLADGNLYIASQDGTLTAINLAILQTVQPSGFQLFRGQLISGGLSDLLSSDDHRLVAQLGIVLNQSEAPIQLILTGTSALANPSELRFRLESSVSVTGLQETIDMWDYTGSAWVNIDTRNASTVEGVVQAVGSNPSRFVAPTTHEVKARISWRATGPVSSYPWRASIDQGVWLER